MRFVFLNIFLCLFFQGEPEYPNEFKVINITRTSIGLAWKKNFDGGEAQKFLIRYRKDSRDPIYKYVETENVNVHDEKYKTHAAK